MSCTDESGPAHLKPAFPRRGSFLIGHLLSWPHRQRSRRNMPGEKPKPGIGIALRLPTISSEENCQPAIQGKSDHGTPSLSHALLHLIVRDRPQPTPQKENSKDLWSAHFIDRL